MTDTKNTTYFRIENTVSGAILGLYPGDTEEEALDAMYRDAGYEGVSDAPGDGHDLEVTEVEVAFRCVSDRYDADGRTPYDSVEDFLRMCESVHGERPELTERVGDWYEGKTLILEPVENAASELAADRVVDGWRVVDLEGGAWWPDAGAADDIARAADPAAEAVRICASEPMRGQWRD